MPLYLNKPVIPKEHGAWPVLIIPIFAGSFSVQPDTSFHILPMVALLVSSVCGFLAISTLRMAIYPPPKTNTERLVVWSVIYSIMSAAPFAYLLLGAGRGGLLWFVIPAAALSGAYFYSSSAGVKRTFIFEMLGMAGLVLSGPAAAYVQQGFASAHGGMIYFLCLVWFTDRTITARRTLELMRKQAKPATVAERVGLFSKELIAHGFGLLLVVGVIGFGGGRWSFALVAPFLAGAIRNVWDTAQVSLPTDPMKVGFAEMRLGIVFCVLQIVIWRL